MYADIDFYSLPEERQRRLIRSDRVATTEALLSQMPDGDPPLRVFDSPVSELILDRLDRGQYTIAQLADEFEVRNEDVRKIVNSFRRRLNAKFSGSYDKAVLLEDRSGVIRVVKDEGPTFYYTLAKIPYFARLVDPTLCVSFLNIDKRLDEFPTLVEGIPAGKADRIDEEYALVIGDFWGIDPQEVFDQITEYDRRYVETTLMPFPVVDAPDEYSTVVERFKQPDSTYQRFRIDESSIEELGRMFVKRAENREVGIRTYQRVAIEMADLKWYAQLKAPNLLRTIDTWVENILQTLNPDIEPVLGSDPSGPEVDDGEKEEIALEDQVLSSLTPELQTVDQVYESLSPITRESVDTDEVEAVLERLATLGVINEEVISGGKRYNSESGTVSFEYFS